MITEYELHINDSTLQLTSADIKNWNDVKIKLTRSNLDGVTRSFTSQFEFVGDAAEVLYEAFLTNGIFAKASISILTLNNRWEYDKLFECDLDFSSVSYENGIFKINAIDNSLAALIKANKGTKYEFIVGSDIAPDDVFRFDRVPVTETVTYEITGGETNDDNGSLEVDCGNTAFFNNNRLYCGSVGDEICVGRHVMYEDDQGVESGSYMLSGLRDVEVTLDWSISVDTSAGNGGLVNLAVVNLYGSTIEEIPLCGISGISRTFLPVTNESELANYPVETYHGSYALIDGIVWAVTYTGSWSRSYWESTGKTKDEYFRVDYSGSTKMTLKKGGNIYIKATHSYVPPTIVTLFSSEFKFSWIARGEACNIDCFKARTVCQFLLDKMTEGRINARAIISGYDSRLAMTRLCAAESIRGIKDAKLYSSFSNFCDWMSAVFGYTYEIGDLKNDDFSQVKEFGTIIGTPYNIEEIAYIGNVVAKNVQYFTVYKCFAYYSNEKWYKSFPGSLDYNSSEGFARTDTIFNLNGKLYCFDASKGLVAYEEQLSTIGQPYYPVTFKHRTELFSDGADVIDIENVTDLSLSVDNGVIYSKVTAGYDEKDYDSVNGRDEFNFNATYSTGYSVNENELSLVSKYRADCYGIEFLAQKRAEDTTDSDSDSDIFFALVESLDGTLVPSRAKTVENTLTDQVFNAAFSPVSCIEANAAYIGMMNEGVTLAFASSTGNSDVEIDGVSFKTPIYIQRQLAKCMTLKFSTDLNELPHNFGDIVRLTYNGTEYEGYIKDMELGIARSETVEYTLIVKSIAV